MQKVGIALAILTPLWINAIGVGMFVLMKYDFTPGTAAAPGIHWPNNTQIPLSADCPTLIMFAHPQCPCTRASIVELGKLIASNKNELNAYVVLLTPKVAPPGWDKAALWHSAQSIPGVKVL